MLPLGTVLPHEKAEVLQALRISKSSSARSKLCKAVHLMLIDIRAKRMDGDWFNEDLSDRLSELVERHSRRVTRILEAQQRVRAIYQEEL